MLEADTILRGRYRIRHQIGKGGMGTVYLAKDENLGTTVAVKQNFFEEPRLIEAFKREARLLAGLRHSALPQVKDYFIEGTGQFLVMEYIAGDDLGTILEKRKQKVPPAGEVKPFDVDEVVRWAEQLLNALDYLHTRAEPIIHRDIKPQNLKLAERSQIILLDFGLAKGKPESMTRVTTTGSIYGYTPNYAPLEQIRGLGTDPRSDLYALGATLYHLLTGVSPIDAATRADAILGGESDPLALALELNGKVSHGLSFVLAKAMEPHRKRRPATAAEMLKLLNESTRPAVIVSQSRKDQESESSEEAIDPDEAITIRDLEEARRKREEEREALETRLQKEREEEERRVQESAGQPEPQVPSRAGEQSVGRSSKFFLRIGGGALLIALLIWGVVAVSNRTDGPPSIPVPAPKPEPVDPARLQPTVQSITGRALAVSMNDDAKVLVSGGLTPSGSEEAVRVWRLEGKKGLRTGRCAAVSRDGKLVASGSEDGTIRLWRADDGQLVKSWREHSDYIFSLGFSPDGGSLFSASGDSTVKLWRLSDGKPMATINTPEDGYLIVTVSPDLRIVAFYRNDGSFKLWSTSDDSFLRYLEGKVPEVTCGVFSNDGQVLALGSLEGDVQLWRVSDGRKIRDLGALGAEVVSLAFTSDGETVAAGLSDGKIKLIRAADGAVIKTLEGHTQSVNSLSFSADSRLLASGSDDATVRIWLVAETTN